MQFVGIFFVVNDKILLHRCPLDEARKNGDLLVYPYSHKETWNKFYINKLYDVDFDFFPRGRIIYKPNDNTFTIYYDKCLEGKLTELTQELSGENLLYNIDENYISHVDVEEISKTLTEEDITNNFSKLDKKL